MEWSSQCVPEFDDRQKNERFGVRTGVTQSKAQTWLEGNVKYAVSTVGTLGNTYATTFTTVPTATIKACRMVRITDNGTYPDSIQSKLTYKLNYPYTDSISYSFFKQGVTNRLRVAAAKGSTDNAVFNLEKLANTGPLTSLKTGDKVYVIANQQGCAVTSDLTTLTLQDLSFPLTKKITPTCNGNGFELKGTPTGGSFSAIVWPGQPANNPVTSSTFKPTQAGTHTLRYTYTSNGYTCQLGKSTLIEPCANRSIEPAACPALSVPNQDGICINPNTTAFTGTLNFSPYDFCAIRSTNNTFTVKLSDSTGSFNGNLVDIGTAFVSFSDVININVPWNFVQASSNYKIRIQTYSTAGTWLYSNEATFPIYSDCTIARPSNNTDVAENSFIQDQIIGEKPQTINEIKNEIVQTYPLEKTELSFKLYPNPATSKVVIAPISEEDTPIEVNIYNLQGQVMLNQKLSNTLTELDTTEFSNGVYIVEVRQSTRVGRKKLVIQK